jgi:outer membrane protein OmpA-like peptidoglycan-associated protein/tetratricopeptide (TPR) repeat protein
MKTIQLIIILAVFGSLSLGAQNQSTKKADKHFSKYEFVEAAAAYNKLVEKGDADAYVYGRLAESNYNIFNTVEAEKWYAKALELGDNPELIYKYSEMLKANGKYDLSNAQMAKFAKLRPSDNRSLAYKANPDYLPKILDEGKKFNVQNLDLNTAVSDFGGTFQDGKLYITTARNSARRNYGWNEQPYLDIYQFTKAEDGSYQGEVMLDGKINTKHHEGLVSFTPEGKTMYFSRESFFENIYEKDSLSNTKYSVLHMYEAKKDGSSWRNVEALPINSENYSIKNPSVSADGSVLYFSSDMPGGYGDFDIYKVSIGANGELGTPENLGQKVNTEGQEMFPYISSENILYFSTNGHLGLGGLDVFYTKVVDGKLTAVRNVGIPVNSNADDFAFTIDESTGEGFVSSNREGGKGSDDIYSVKKLQPLCDTHIVASVVDKKTGVIIPGATVSLLDSQGNKIATKTSDAKGEAEFMVECGTDTELKATMADYVSAKQAIKGSEEEDVKVELSLDPIEKLVVADKVVLNPIYFDYDKSNITSRAAFELDKLVQVMNKYPDMVIYATSHTDSRGSNSYNERLSDRRAKTTVQYVISKGISGSRLSGVGKGENEPRVNCGTNCSEDEHQMNRRSEFTITSGGPQAQ